MKSGFVAIVGRPSAGKSTLLNALCGEKVAITSAVPQTTRNAIRGIINTREGQIVFLDTPGYHQSEKKLNIYLKDVVHRSLDDADAVLYVVDAGRAPGKEEQAVMELLARTSLPIVVAVNKIDGDTPLISEIRGLIMANLKAQAVLNISALEGTNLGELTDAVLEACPDGEPHYPEDFYTDQNPEFRIAEIIREQAIIRSNQELPHALYVDIADLEFDDPRDDVYRKVERDTADEPAEEREPANLEISTGKNADKPATPSEELPAGAPAGFFDDTEAMEKNQASEQQPRRKLWVRAFLTVERHSQVGILVGRGGTRIKEIRIASLREMKKIFPWKIRLDLRVKVNPKWRKKDPLLKRMMGPGE